jgi:hypothetical protein
MSRRESTVKSAQLAVSTASKAPSISHSLFSAAARSASEKAGRGKM